MSERITESDLRRWETDETYESHAMARPPIIVLVAEVRRLRGLIVAAHPDATVRSYTATPAAAELEAEARAIREERASLDKRA